MRDIGEESTCMKELAEELELDELLPEPPAVGLEGSNL
jgi:hypothetical protein